MAGRKLAGGLNDRYETRVVREVRTDRRDSGGGEKLYDGKVKVSGGEERSRLDC